jgi:glycosyltransferase involved in cell wall biosynthesis
MVYIILPLYNEEESVSSIVKGIRDELSGMQYKIIAINDGSSDRTLKLLNELNRGGIIVSSHLVNMNIGVVLLTGLMRAFLDSNHKDDIIIIMEADQTSPAVLLKRLISEINSGNDVVIASHYQKGGGYKNFPLHRKIFSH